MSSIEDRKREEIEFHNKVYQQDNSYLQDARQIEKQLVGNVYTVYRNSLAYYDREVTEYSFGKKQILDIGCGDFACSRSLAKLDAHVVAIDLSDVGIRRASEWARQCNISNIEFKVMDAEKLEYPDNHFDLVCGASILHHVDIPRVLNEAARVLKPGGTAIFLDTLGHNPVFNVFRNMTPHSRTSYEHPLRMKDMREMEQYFDVIHTRYFHLLTYAAIPFNKAGLRGAVDFFDGLDSGLFKALPFMGRYASNFIITMKNRKRA